MIQTYFSTLLQCFFTLLSPFACSILLLLTVLEGPCQQFSIVLADISDTFFDIAPDGNAQFSRAEAGTAIEIQKETFSLFLNDFLSNGPTNRLSIKTPESFSPKPF